MTERCPRFLTKEREREIERDRAKTVACRMTCAVTGMWEWSLFDYPPRTVPNFIVGKKPP